MMKVNNFIIATVICISKIKYPIQITAAKTNWYMLVTVVTLYINNFTYKKKNYKI